MIWQNIFISAAKYTQNRCLSHKPPDTMKAFETLENKLPLVRTSVKGETIFLFIVSICQQAPDM